MDFSRLDKTISEPFYIQLKNLLIDEISSNKLRSMQRIPSVRTISKLAGVSPMTVTQAIRILQNEGWLYSIPGKGTFVEEKLKVIQKWQRIVGFSDEIRTQGLVPNTKVIAFVNEALIDKSVAEKLRLDLGSNVIKLARIRYANNLPVAFATAYLDSTQVPGIENIDFGKQSLYHVLQTTYQKVLSRAYQTIEMVKVDKTIGDYLQLEPDSECFLTERITYTDDDLPIEYVKSYYRGDHMRFSVELGTNGISSLSEIKNIVKHRP